MNLISGGFVLFVEVKYHQSCIDFPHCHLISCTEQAEKNQRPRLGGQTAQRNHRRCSWIRTPRLSLIPVWALGNAPG